MSTPQSNDANAPVSTQELEHPLYWKPWVIKHIDTENGEEQFHLLPEEDTGAHLHSGICDCKPWYAGFRTTLGGRELPFFVHRSWDNREISEWWYYNIQHPDLGRTDNDIE